MHIVIIGNGIAGINAARNLARGDLSRLDIDMFTDEPYLYYPRPRLPAFVAGETTEQELIQYPPSWYERRGIRMHLSSAVAELDPAGKRIVLADGSSMGYDRLLLANGSRPNIPPFKGTEKAGVYTLRTMDDAKRIQEQARRVGQVVVIGGGLLGLEAARAISVLGPKVTILELFGRLLPVQLDTPGAAVLQRLMESRGMTVVTGASTQEITGVGEVSGVRLADGREFPGQMVLISAGIRSNLALARSCGLPVNRGLLVNTAMQTNVPEIYAAGDVAEFNGRVWGIVPSAVEQSRVAAANMLEDVDHPAELYKEIVPSNTLKVVGIDLTSIGLVNPEGEGYDEIRTANEEAGTYEKLVLQNGRVVGAILLGDRSRVGPVTELIVRQVDVSAHRDQLMQPSFSLDSLLP